MSDSLFPTPTLDDWRALALRGLKGEPFERLQSRTRDGIEIQPLYAEAADGPNLADRPAPAADASRPWDLRAVIDAASPQANSRALEALNGGAASLLIEVGGGDEDLQDRLAAVLDGVLLDLAPVALDAGYHGPQAANALAVLAKGAPEAPLAFHLDPLSRFIETGRSPGDIAAHVNAAAQAGARHAGAYPRASLFLASGRAIHEAGGTEAQSLGVMAAAVVAYARALGEAGLDADAALMRIVMGVSTDQTYPVGIASTRAARAIWSRLAGACGSTAPARIEARASRRMLSGQGAWNNLLRQTAAVFAAGVGGVDAVVLDPFTEALGGDNALARRQARNIQLVLMEEAHVARVADPAGGAGFFETLTDDLARAGWAFFQRIEAEGGLVAALESGLVQDAVEASREALLASVKGGETPVLGVSLFPDADERAPTLDTVAAPQGVSDDAVRQGGADGACRALPPIRLTDGLEAAQ